MEGKMVYVKDEAEANELHRDVPTGNQRCKTFELEDKYCELLLQDLFCERESRGKAVQVQDGCEEASGREYIVCTKHRYFEMPGDAHEATRQVLCDDMGVEPSEMQDDADEPTGREHRNDMEDKPFEGYDALRHDDMEGKPFEGYDAQHHDDMESKSSEIQDDAVKPDGQVRRDDMEGKPSKLQNDTEERNRQEQLDFMSRNAVEAEDESDESNIQVFINDAKVNVLQSSDVKDIIFLLIRFFNIRSVCYTLILTLTFGHLFSGTNSAFVEFPVNEVALQLEQRQAVEMKCKSDCQCDLIWFVNKHGSVKETLYDGYFLRSRAKSYCKVLKDEPGKCQLDLTNTEDAAQTYTCLEPGTLNETSADLILIGVHNCYENSTEDVVHLACSIEFRGNWAPTMEWKEQSSYGEKVLSVGVNIVTVPNQRVTSTLVMPIQEGIRNYTCTTKFDIRHKTYSTTARNVPDWNKVWSFPEFGYQDKLTTDSGAKVRPAPIMAVWIGIGAGLLLLYIATVSCFVVRKAMFRK